ncbi:hypothetical protein [Streptomyces geranii]|uniref:hypothetical protein n=1 Tax=Streptomyces geranii TaxID=2058923 RepID=UPI0018E58951|nr:hypothetical protein [Streptomyces geranii]
MDTQDGQVKAKQTEFRRLRTAAANHLRAPSPSALVNGLRRTGNGYLRLADAVQQAENLDARSITAANRRNAYLHAATVATETLGVDDTVTQELNRRLDNLEPERWTE